MIVTPVIRFPQFALVVSDYVGASLRGRPESRGKAAPHGRTPLQLSVVLFVHELNGPTSDNDQTRQRFSQVHQVDVSVHANHGLRVDNEQKQNPRRAASRPCTSLPPA